ncbi:hypothetical protein AXE80_07360 [Wenyingzhuangia fucanilytica]|uniref:Glycosyl hydrolase family 95 N-terminal domain-containing protein n=2 Tax=Wenyingzhuangia fucanilytica TaxID=1790137 RepID=A0A1B1Y5T4_9FLAO|nr:hypothetical protein AXE80_07360 [Wenyingzhuangia fucanilytica]
MIFSATIQVSAQNGNSATSLIKKTDFNVAIQDNNENSKKELKLWYNKPAPNSNEGWINRSIPMGNGYMGANVFGGTETERIQITENSLYDWGKDRGLRRRGLNNFSEVYIDFKHTNTTDYKQELNLNKGILS